VYDTAILEHRDPDAAVRKARYITAAMAQDLARTGEIRQKMSRGFSSCTVDGFAAVGCVKEPTKPHRPIYGP
jgi:hypothetical protein